MVTAERLSELQDLTVEKLIAMSNHDFDRVVDDEIRRMHDSDERRRLRGLLSHPAVADRWEIVLVGMKKSVEGQLGYKKSDLQRAFLKSEKDPTPENKAQYYQKREDFLDWRGGSLRFKNGVEERLNDIRKVQFTEGRSINLAEAIRDHRAKVLREFSDDVSDADLELWKKVVEKVGA